MHPQEKMAWYTLAVVVLTILSYLLLLTLSGHNPGSQGAFGLLGLLGYAGKFAAKGKTKFINDEHDREIARKALLTTFLVFWFYFVLYGMSSVFYYSEMIPSHIMGSFIWSGTCVCAVVYSVVILVFYRVDATEKRTIVDWFKDLTALRGAGLGFFFISLIVLIPFIFPILKAERGEMSLGIAYIFCANPVLIYLVVKKNLSSLANTDQNKQILSKSRNFSYLVMGIAVLVSVLILIVFEDFTKEFDLPSKIPLVIYSILMAGILSLALGLIKYGGINETNNSTTSLEN